MIEIVTQARMNGLQCNTLVSADVVVVSVAVIVDQHKRHS